jgi:menaquinone-dependent protoporphyrinogen oxidase
MTEQTTSRRKFMRKGCLTSAAVGLAVCGGGALALTYPPKIDLPETTYGETTMQNRVLVAYGTKAGSTAEVAARIGQALSQKNAAVDVLPVKQVKDLSAYTTVVLGSAIRMGSVLPEVKNFIEKNQAVLSQKSFSLFIVCMTLSEETEAKRAEASGYLEPIRALVKPASEGLFAGVMDGSRLPLFERLIMKAMKTPAGDYRNWEQINAWTASLPL